MSKGKILVVDDDKEIIEILVYNLNKEGFIIQTAQNGEEAIIKAEEFKPDLILLDVMMPGMDGIEVCYRLRENQEFKKTLIVFSSARSEDFTQLSAFSAGADDYIIKPIKPRILISRLNAMLQRHLSTETVTKEDVISVSDLVINIDTFSVLKNEVNIPLVKKEFELLTLLVSKPGKVFRREEIINKVWGTEVIVGDRTIDVHIRKLREKIAPDYFITVKGMGYKFNEEI